MKLFALSFVVVGAVLLAGCTEHGKGGGIPGGGDGGIGRSCGGGGDSVGCDADEFCDFGRNQCGADDASGTCQPRPTSCDDSFEPVCGCDGVVHSNPCDANAAGVDLNAFGGCPVDPGSFACGFRVCDVNFQFCSTTGSDVGGEPDSFGCQQLPACPSQFATCGCLVDSGVPCAEQCSGDGVSGLTVTCFGG